MSEKIQFVSGDKTWDEMPDYKEVKAVEDEQNKEKLKTLGLEYRALERDFGQEFTDADDKKERLNYTIKKYEDRVRHNRFLAKLARSSMKSEYGLAEFEGIVVDRPGETIEAKSGVMYAERLGDLKEAIRGSELGEDEKRADLEGLGRTLGLVMAHIERQFDEASDDFEAKANDRARTEAHNQVIEQLNWMNEVAEKYGVRRFCCRDFLTSRGYNKNSDFNGALGRRMKSDRAIVERYFELAYKERVENIRRKLGRASLGTFLY